MIMGAYCVGSITIMGAYCVGKQGSKIALVRSYLRVPQAAGQVEL